MTTTPRPRVSDIDLEDLKAQYQAGLDKLDDVIATMQGGPTTPEAVQGILDLARIMKRLLKGLKHVLRLAE